MSSGYQKFIVERMQCSNRHGMKRSHHGFQSKNSSWEL